VHAVPGRVEAEDYDVSVGSPAFADTTAVNEGGAYRFDAVDIEVLNRTYSIGWIRSGEFLTYSVDTAAAGDFALTLSVANAEAITKPVRVSLDGVPAGEVMVGSTGSWTVFREFGASAPLTIPQGRHVLTIGFEGVERLNFDWLNLAAIVPTPIPTPMVTAVPEAPYPAEHVLPATIEAEHFDVGGEGVAYHDYEPANLGTERALRPGEGVDIETAGGATAVCFVRAGEFLNYSVDTTAADNVTLVLRAANPDATTKTVNISLDGVPAGQVPVSPTGGWTDYREFSTTTPLAMPEGRHVVTIAFEGVNRLNFDWLNLSTAVSTMTPTPTPTPTATETVTPTPTATTVPAAPYPAAHVLPAQVEAEHFDAGGEGAAYHDYEPANLGNELTLRPGEGVDIETNAGITDVCFVRAGEYLNYSVDTTATGDFFLTLLAANPDATTKAVNVSLDGIPAGQVPIAPTGGWAVYREFGASAPVTIPEGRHVLTIAFEGINRLNFDWLSLATEIPTATPTLTTTPTATVTPIDTGTPDPEYPLVVTGLELVTEWVSIRNTGGAPVNLQGCTLSNAESTRVYTFPSFVLGPGATVKIHSRGGTDTETDLYWGIGPTAWADDRDTATLKRPDGTVISSLTRVRWA
jgi:hypothetical protein